MRIFRSAVDPGGTIGGGAVVVDFPSSPSGPSPSPAPDVPAICSISDGLVYRCTVTLPMNTYPKGSRPRIPFQFNKVSDNSLVDPDNVYLEYTVPGEDLATLQYGVDAELVKSSTGLYYADIDADVVGTYLLRAYGTGAAKASCLHSFNATI